MKVVLDTNILVSGLLSPFGPCAKILRLLFHDKITPYYDGRILWEYENVLYRPKFQFDQNQLQDFLDFFISVGQLMTGTPLKKSLPDPGDEPFLEVAIADKAQALITGNMKHFPVSSRQGVRVLSPGEFVGNILERQKVL